MAVINGIEAILAAANTWREECFLGEGSLFAEARLWTADHLDELNRYFVENLDYGSGTFIEKFQAQIAPASAEAKQLAAEMLYVMMLFPNNVSRQTKLNLITSVWEWSLEPFPRDHPLIQQPLARGVGSAGMGYGAYRPAELVFFILLLRDWRIRPAVEQQALLGDAWQFAAWLDTIPGAQNRQFRHMLLYLLFPDQFERISSSSHKAKIDAAFASVLEGAGEKGTSYLARDLRLLQIRQALEKQYPGQKLDFYGAPLEARWNDQDEGSKPYSQTPIQPENVAERPAAPAKSESDPPYVEPPFPEILSHVKAQGLRISAQTLRRYHLALRARGFVILSGVSGTGKTWLAEAYARAVGARHLIVPVAPNWTTNEDLLGYVNPLDGEYHDTTFSRFLREAAAEYEAARAAGRISRPFHLVLDEMNLARVEYYFARFLSAMEVRTRNGGATIELGPHEQVLLPPTLRFVGTVNVDETTHGFADKVYDRAQLIEMEASREVLEEHLAGAQHQETLLEIWDAVHEVAPFAFRVVDEIGHYVGSAEGTGATLDELLDEQVLQKILPKLKGTDPRLGDVLARLEELAHDRFPLSYRKIHRMREGFQQHGFASFF